MPLILGLIVCIWATLVLDGLRVRRPRCEEAAKQGYANATELADYLVAKEGFHFAKLTILSVEVVVSAIEQGKSA